MFLQILSLLLALVVTRVVWRRWKYDLHKVPSPPGLPLLGHTLEFVYGQPNRQLSQWIGVSLKRLGYPKMMRVSKEARHTRGSLMSAGGRPGGVLVGCHGCEYHQGCHVVKDSAVSKSHSRTPPTGNLW